ncbi:MAG: hypothetical protein GY866_41860 [Proteobacteria bacterium]|nr:hypothetical protein [Pseudomonadota bacterium]
MVYVTGSGREYRGFVTDSVSALTRYGYNSTNPWGYSKGPGGVAVGGCGMTWGGGYWVNWLTGGVGGTGRLWVQ